jgi:predicted DNA-binding transcriptional regulator AlpA
MPNVEEVLTLPEVAKLLRVAEFTLRSWRQHGKGPKAFKMGRRVMYAARDVDAWIKEQINNATDDRQRG